MQIRVKSIHGRDEQFELSPEDTVERLQQLCVSKFNVEASRTRLIFRGRHLGDLNATLSDVGVTDGLVVHLVERPPNVEPIPVDPAERNRPRRGRPPNFLRDILSQITARAPEGILTGMGVPEFDDARGSTVQRTVTLRRSTLTQVAGSGSRLQLITQEALNQMNYLPEEFRRSIDVSWQNGLLRITIPPFSAPHVATPALERVHTIDSIFHSLRHYRSILVEDNRFVLLIDSIINGSHPDDAYLLEQARVLADRLENVPRVPLRRGAGEVDDGSPEAQGRFERFGVSEGNDAGHGVLRHVLDTDLSGLLDELWEHHRWLEPFIRRYRQLISSRMLFNINDSVNLATDGRANLICVYFEHIQQTLHRLAHATHVLSDLNVHLNDPVPRRLYPQFSNFRVAPGSRGELMFQIVNSNPESEIVHSTAGNILHSPVPGTDPLLHPDGRPTLMTLFPTGIGVVHQVAAMMVEATVTVDGDSDGDDDENDGDESDELSPLTSGSAPVYVSQAQSDDRTPVTMTSRTQNIQDRLSQFSSIRNMNTTILRRLAVDIHSLVNRASSNSSSGNIYEDLFRSLIAAAGSTDGSEEVASYMRGEADVAPTVLLRSLLQFLNDGIVNRVVTSDAAPSISTGFNAGPSGIVTASQAAANLFGQRLGNLSFPASSRTTISSEQLPGLQRLPAANVASGSSGMRSIRSAPNMAEEGPLGFLPVAGSSAAGSRNSRVPFMPNMEEVQGLAGGSFPSQGRNEQFIPLDPFLLCNSRFSRLRDGGRNLSHYEQVTRGHLTRRPIRPPPQEYVALQVNSTNDGALIFDDHDEERLTQFIQLSVRSLIAQMHERDGNRTARASPPVNSVLRQIHSMQEASMPTEHMMIGPAVGISLSGGDLPPDLAQMIPAALRNRLQVAGHRSHSASSRSDAGSDPRSPSRVANTANSFSGSAAGDTRNVTRSAPSAKKRKVNETVSDDSGPSTSNAESVRRNVFPTGWRAVIDRDANENAILEPLSAGYNIGLPSEMRNGGYSSTGLPRQTSVGGVMSNLDHLTVQGIYDPQDDDLS